MAVVNELKVHVNEDRVEDEGQLVSVQVEGGVDKLDQVVVGVLINCRVIVGLQLQGMITIRTHSRTVTPGHTMTELTL